MSVDDFHTCLYVMFLIKNIKCVLQYRSTVSKRLLYILVYYVVSLIKYITVFSESVIAFLNVKLLLVPTKRHY